MNSTTSIVLRDGRLAAAGALVLGLVVVTPNVVAGESLSVQSSERAVVRLVALSLPPAALPPALTAAVKQTSVAPVVIVSQGLGASTVPTPRAVLAADEAVALQDEAVALQAVGTTAALPGLGQILDPIRGIIAIPILLGTFLTVGILSAVVTLIQSIFSNATPVLVAAVPTAVVEPDPMISALHFERTSNLAPVAKPSPSVSGESKPAAEPIEPEPPASVPAVVEEAVPELVGQVEAAKPETARPLVREPLRFAPKLRGLLHQRRHELAVLPEVPAIAELDPATESEAPKPDVPNPSESPSTATDSGPDAPAPEDSPPAE